MPQEMLIPNPCSPLTCTAKTSFVLQEKMPNASSPFSNLLLFPFHVQFGWLQPPGHTVQWEWWRAAAAEAGRGIQWAAAHRGGRQEVPFPAGVRQPPLFPQFQFQFQVCLLAPPELTESWVFLYVCVCQQIIVTWCCFYPSTGMRWRALINQVEPLTRRWWAFIIWFTLSWMGPVFYPMQLPMIPSLWYVFFPQSAWQCLWLKESCLTRDVQNISKITPLNRKGEVFNLFLDIAMPT